MMIDPHVNMINALNMEKKAQEEYESAKKELEYMQKEKTEMHLKLWQQTWEDSRKLGETVEDATKLANAAIEIENNVWNLTEEDQYSKTIGKVKKAQEDWEKSKIEVIKASKLRDERIEADRRGFNFKPSLPFGPCPRSSRFGSSTPSYCHFCSSPPRAPSFTFGSGLFGSAQPEQRVRSTLSPDSQIGLFGNSSNGQSRFGEVPVKRSKYLLVSDMIPSAVDIWAKKHTWKKYVIMVARDIKAIFTSAEDKHYDKLKIRSDVNRIARKIRAKDAHLLKTSREIVWVLLYKEVIANKVW